MNVRVLKCGQSLLVSHSYQFWPRTRIHCFITHHTTRRASQLEQKVEIPEFLSPNSQVSILLGK